MLVVLLALGCGGRTDLPVDSVGYDGTPSGGSDLAAPSCPVCTDARDECLRPNSYCAGADGCTVGWCERGVPIRDVNMCVNRGSSFSPYSLCSSLEAETLCSDQWPSLSCTWQPGTMIGGVAFPFRCRSTSDPGAIACGRIHCDPRCKCLCDNFCWCGPMPLTPDGG